MFTHLLFEQCFRGVQAFLSSQITLLTLPFGHFCSLFWCVQPFTTRLHWCIHACLNKFVNGRMILFSFLGPVRLRVCHACNALLLQEFLSVRFVVSPSTLSVASFGFFTVKLLARHVLYLQRFFSTAVDCAG